MLPVSCLRLGRGSGLVLGCLLILGGAVPFKETVKVERGSITAEVQLKGVFEAEQTAPVSVAPKAWSKPLRVKSAVPHGQEVASGDCLIELDTEEIDEDLADLRVQLALSKLERELAEKELPVLEKLLPLDLAAAEREKQQADEDLKLFLEVDRPMAEENAEFSVRSANQYLAQAREELIQLEKMYRDKDLTEETEEMILQRQRFQVEAAEHRLEQQKQMADKTLNVELPRREQTAQERSEKQELELVRAKSKLPLDVDQKRVSLEKLQREIRKTEARLAKLEGDREALTIRAPSSGVVYYGQANRGRFPDVETAGRNLQPGSILQPGQVLLTVVTIKPLRARVDIKEEDLYLLKNGLEGELVPTGFPNRKLNAKLTKVHPIPVASGTFEAFAALDSDEELDFLVPGMTCSLELDAERANDALVVPSSAIFEDDDEPSPYVYKVDGEDEPQKTPVKVGVAAKGKTEILEGLEEGDEILTSKP